MRNSLDYIFGTIRIHQLSAKIKLPENQKAEEPQPPRPGFFRLQSPGPSLAELLVANAHSRVLGQFAGTVATSMRRTAPAGISCTAMPCATSVPSFRTRWE